MSGGTVGLLGFAVLVVAALVLDAAERRRGGPGTAARALMAAMRTTPGRVTVWAAWVWLGVHFLAR